MSLEVKLLQEEIKMLSSVADSDEINPLASANLLCPQISQDFSWSINSYSSDMVDANNNDWPIVKSNGCKK